MKIWKMGTINFYKSVFSMGVKINKQINCKFYHENKI